MQVRRMDSARVRPDDCIGAELIWEKHQQIRLLRKLCRLRVDPNTVSESGGSKSSNSKKPAAGKTKIHRAPKL